MTDIGFDQIREGQTVRLHCKEGFSIEGPVAYKTVQGTSLRLGSLHGAEVWSSSITRVELLSEPAPKWEVGQLAEIDWQTTTFAKRETDTVRRAGEPLPCWRVLSGGFQISDESVIGEPRLLKAVPADAVIVAQGAPVLPPLNPATGQKWSQGYMRDWARHYAEGSHLNVLLSAVADAIEEAQR